MKLEKGKKSTETFDELDDWCCHVNGNKGTIRAANLDEAKKICYGNIPDSDHTTPRGVSHGSCER